MLTLRVRVRDANGQLLQTLKTFSNQQAPPDFTLRSFKSDLIQGRHEPDRARGGGRQRIDHVIRR
jgi:hypothetical protein